VAEVKVKISGDARPFGQAVRRATNDINTGLLGGIRGQLLAFAGSAALANAARQTIEFASRFNDASQKLGVGVEFLQEASYAAEQTGASLSDVEVALRNLQRAQVTALSGGSSAAEAFERLGVSLTDLKTLNPEQMFRRVGDHIAKSNPSAQQLSDTIKLMGRSADALLPAFRSGFSEMAESAQRLGLIISEEVITQLDDMGDSIDTIALKMRSSLAPAMSWLADRLADTWSFVETSIAAPARFLGALSGGASASEASAAAGEVTNQMIDEYTNRDDEREARRERRRLVREAAGGAGVVPGVQKPVAAQGLLEIQQDQFARMGLFVSGGARDLNVSMLGQLRKSNQFLSDIKDNTAQTNDVLEDGL